VPDRSVSVPMTLSDLERWDARVTIIFKRISVITLVPFDIELPNSAGYHVTRGVLLGGNCNDPPQEGVAQRSPFWRFTSIYAYTL